LARVNSNIQTNRPAPFSLFISLMIRILSSIDYDKKCLYYGIGMLVKDNRYSTLIETKFYDGLEDRSDKYATFSNSRFIVWTNNSLFERQWTESELANTTSSG
jgi:hypothetical protein